MANDRVSKLKAKYGEDIFKKWGKGTRKRPGGSPVLNAYAEGRVIIKKKVK